MIHLQIVSHSIDSPMSLKLMHLSPNNKNAKYFYFSARSSASSNSSSYIVYLQMSVAKRGPKE